eukprot:CAMPEP_0119332548 /NCGR_PEP_ID=MMETSP1333-20130426/83028_1 /TAXON_ID=418940 /ORGANISM="Scyphosphaera apsteinii, Strain RCC1455" /LENGTH=579 /DNA_ID=CAMNT_0007342407 /DNA_START=189 /DNA_END=1929 /DNA_ORIENTATION=+
MPQQEEEAFAVQWTSASPPTDVTGDTRAKPGATPAHSMAASQLKQPEQQQSDMHTPQHDTLNEMEAAQRAAERERTRVTSDEAATNYRLQGTEEGACRASMSARRETLAAAEQGERTRRQQERAESWGARYPAATDWMRRDAAELAWRQRQRHWGLAPSTLSGSDDLTTGPTDDILELDDDVEDWRIGDFERLLAREQRWRRGLYRWWLDIWDASGSDYLFEADEVDVGFPITRMDGTPWETRQSNWVGAETEVRQRIRSSSSQRRWRSDGRLQDFGHDLSEDFYDQEVELNPRKLAQIGSNYAASSVSSHDKASSRSRRSKWKPSVRETDMSRTSELHESEEEPQQQERSAAAPREPAHVHDSGSRSDMRSQGQDSDLDDENVDWLLEEPSTHAYHMERSQERSRQLERRAVAERKMAEYIVERLHRLHERVGERMEEMELRETELSEREVETAARLRKLKADADTYMWPDQFSTMPAAFAQAERALRQTRQARARLHEERSALWEAIDTAMARQTELQQVSVALRTEGMRGLRKLLNRRQVSHTLRKYLARLMSLHLAFYAGPVHMPPCGAASSTAH